MGIDMVKVKLSSKFQIVIPREVREKLNLKPGEEIVMIEKCRCNTLSAAKTYKANARFRQRRRYTKYPRRRGSLLILIDSYRVVRVFP